MDVVIKVGGSLAETPLALKMLGTELCRLAKMHQITVVPGGGKFADAIRDLDIKFNLSATVAHQMAILAIDQYGMLLSQVIPHCGTCDSLKEAQKISERGRAALFLPSKLLLKNDPFQASWEVTSDSISAYVAVMLKVPKVIFVTDVDGVFTEDPKNHPSATLQGDISACELLEFGKRTSVDKFLPKFLMENPLDCYVVNGHHPERMERILLGKGSLCTRITVLNKSGKS